MGNRAQSVATAVLESLSEPRRPRPKRLRSVQVQPEFPLREENCLQGVFAWLSKCGSSRTGHQLNEAFLFGRPIRTCDRCHGTGLLGGEESEVAGVEAALGDRQCERCDGSGVVSVWMHNPITEWYIEPSPGCPDGVHNCSGANAWSEEVRPRACHANESEYREPDPSAYAWIGRQLARLLKVERTHGATMVAVLQAWYGTEGRNYAAEEVPLTTDDALRTLRQAVEDGNLELPSAPGVDNEELLWERLKLFNDEFGSRKKPELTNKWIPPLSADSIEVGDLLLPQRRIRAQYLGRLARLEALWPATKLGKRELRGFDGTGMREHVCTRKGGPSIVAQLDREAERLLRRAQQGWLETESAKAEPDVDRTEYWQVTWKTLQAAWLFKAGIETIPTENLDEFWAEALDVIQQTITNWRPRA